MTATEVVAEVVTRELIAAEDGSTVNVVEVGNAGAAVELLEVGGAQGPEGIPGPRGEAGLSSPSVFVGPDPPVDPPGAYLWIETGLGADGQGFTVWFDDATP